MIEIYFTIDLLIAPSYEEKLEMIVAEVIACCITTVVYKNTAYQEVIEMGLMNNDIIYEVVNKAWL